MMLLRVSLLWLSWSLVLWPVWSMHSKRTSYQDNFNHEIPNHKRLRFNLADLFLSNQISGQRAQTLFADGDVSGASSCRDLAASGSSGRHARNAQRDLTARLLKRSKWPPLYWADIRLFNTSTQTMERQQIPFLLVHELLQAMAVHSCSKDALLCKEGLSRSSRAHFDRLCTELRQSDMVPLGLWADGVPYNWDRSLTLDMVSLLFPGQQGSNASVRLPLVCLEHTFVAKPETHDDIFAVISWSFRHLATGLHPACRHDGCAWLKSDSFRKKRSLRPLDVHACLIEVRADWKCLKDVFRFPQHNENRGCCWRCRATPATIREVGSNASWRNSLLDHWSCIGRIIAGGGSVSPLFSTPGLQHDMFVLDWLHIVDQGISADFQGNLLYMLVPRMPGNNNIERCKALFLEIKQYYALHRTDVRYTNLVITMLRKKQNSPKLRGRAAEVRGLVDFSAQAAQRWLDSGVEFEASIKEAMLLLQQCYNCLSKGSFHAATLSNCARRFCLLAVAIEAAAPEGLWRIKPKLHLFQHLTESGSNPSDSWFYRDEEFGGSVAQVGRRRGGANTARSAGVNVLNKFRANHALPIF